MTVEQFLIKQDKWRTGLEVLRSMLLKQGFEETIKWGMPVYTINNKNVVGLGAFKDHFGIWFFNGMFLQDPNHILINAQENKTQAMRQIRFHSAEEIDPEIITEYLKQAKKNQLEGKEFKPVRKKVPELPPTLKEALAADEQLAQAYSDLTESCKREYVEYIAEAKKEETQHRRIQKIIPMILSKKSLNEKYK